MLFPAYIALSRFSGVRIALFAIPVSSMIAPPTPTKSLGGKASFRGLYPFLMTAFTFGCVLTFCVFAFAALAVFFLFILDRARSFRVLFESSQFLDAVRINQQRRNMCTNICLLEDR